MAFPSTSAPTVTLQTTNANVHTYTIPAHNSGDLIVLFMGHDGFPPSQGMAVASITALNGAAWTIHNSLDQGQTIATPSSTFAWVRATSNQATSTTVNATLAASRSEMGVCHAYLVTGHHATTNPEFAFGQGSGGTIPYDPPALNPAGWDVEDTLWFFAVTADSNTTTTTFATTPSGWTLRVDEGVADAKLLSGFRPDAVASLDPAGGNLSEAEQTISWTVAVRPTGVAPVAVAALPAALTVAAQAVTPPASPVSVAAQPAALAVAAQAVTPPGGLTGHSQGAFRIRSDDSQADNADAGWAQPLNTDATIDLETVFGIRIEVGEFDATPTGATVYKLQSRVDQGGGFSAWTDVPTSAGPGENVNYQEVMVYPSVGASDGTATTDVLSFAGNTFVAGSVETGGVQDASNATASVSLTDQHTEFEWRVRLHKLSEGPTVLDVGDVFEFRVVRSNNSLLDNYTHVPTVTVGPSVGVVGGTYVEAPNRCGPLEDGNGNLYVIGEYAVTQNQLVLLKSTDAGATWQDTTATGKPTWNDIESSDFFIDNHVLHIAIQGVNQDNVVYGRYHASSHPTTPDTWQITETVDPSDNPTHQNAVIALRANNTVPCFYTELDTGTDHIAYKVRADGGPWGAETVIDAGAGAYHHVTLAHDTTNDLVYVFIWESTGEIWWRTFNTSDVLSSPTSLVSGLPTSLGQNRHPLLPPRYYTSGGNDYIVCIYKDAAGELSEIVFTNGTPGSPVKVTTDAVRVGFGASGKPAAGACVTADNTAHVVYGRNSDNDLYHVSRPHGGAWSAPTLFQASPDVNWINLEPVTGGVGVFWDAGSNGGTGYSRFDLLAVGASPVSVAALPASVSLAAQAVTPTLAAHAHEAAPAALAVAAQAATFAGNLQVVTPAAVDENLGGWVAVGAASIPVALADLDDATYAESPSAPTTADTLVVTASPANVPDVDDSHSYVVRAQGNAVSGSPAMFVTAEWVTGTPGSYTVIKSGGEIALTNGVWADITTTLTPGEAATIPDGDFTSGVKCRLIPRQA